MSKKSEPYWLLRVERLENERSRLLMSDAKYELALPLGEVGNCGRKGRSCDGLVGFDGIS